MAIAFGVLGMGGRIVASQIGIRAIREIKSRAFEHDKTIKETLESMGLYEALMRSWKKNAPSGKCLRTLALNGYDIYYILTGQRRADNATD